jgi:hypothetical protein
LSSIRMGRPNRNRMIGCVLEYLEWWRSVQAAVPEADALLSSLVSTAHMSKRRPEAFRWQAGFAHARAPMRYNSWILEDVAPVNCRYARVTDAARSSGAFNDNYSIRDGIGCCYRAIRRHIFRRYVRRHRACLRGLAKLSRDDCLSLAADGICATCLAYAVWRMSIEQIIVVEGLFVPRRTNYEIRLTEPSASSPSDDRARLSFTYMQFFGIWSAIVDRTPGGWFTVGMQETISSPQILFTRDTSQPADAPLRTIHCIYPEGEGMATKAGRPCKAPWTLRPTENACVLRSRRRQKQCSNCMRKAVRRPSRPSDGCGCSLGLDGTHLCERIGSIHISHGRLGILPADVFHQRFQVPTVRRRPVGEAPT